MLTDVPLLILDHNYDADGHGSFVPIVSMGAIEGHHNDGRLSTLRTFSDPVTSVKGLTSDRGSYDAGGDIYLFQ